MRKIIHPKTKREGLFITFEGIEGCGKTTQARIFADWLKSRGVKTVLTREAGATRLGRVFRKILLDPRRSALSPLAETFLYIADRAVHIKEVIAPNLKKGNVVISDRFHDATVAYQGYGRGAPIKLIENIHGEIVGSLVPDITFFLDISPRVGLRRARRRDLAFGKTETEGRFEAEALAFHEKVRNGYLKIAKSAPRRFEVIDADGEVGEVQHKIRFRFKKLLAL